MTTSAQTTGAYDPQSYQQFMNPYQQEVIDKYSQEMQRNFDISRQGRAAQALGAGAFGGGREGVLEAEAQRGFQQQLGTGIAGPIIIRFSNCTATSTIKHLKINDKHNKLLQVYNLQVVNWAQALVNYMEVLVYKLQQHKQI